MFCQIRSPNANGGRDAAAGGVLRARSTGVPPARALRLAWRMDLRPVRELRGRANQRCSVVPPLGGSGFGCAVFGPCDPEPPKGGTTIRGLWTTPRWELRDARCSMLDARCSMLDARCSMFDVRCSMFDVRCSWLVARHSSFRSGATGSRTRTNPKPLPISHLPSPISHLTVSLSPPHPLPHDFHH